MEIKRTKSTCYENCFDYDFIFDDLKLRFFYGGNNDIYLCVQSLDEDNDIEVAELRFTKENYEVYEKFYSLYHTLLTGDVYKDDAYESEVELLDFEDDFDNYFYRSASARNDDARKYSRWSEFVDGEVINLMSDNNEEDYSSRLSIYLDGEDLVFKFVRLNPCDMFLTFEISTSGSRYQPFDKAFMDLYNSVQELDLDYHQIHLEELIYSLRKKV